ncbi:MAG: hypothetical protein ABJG68_11760 [Crocinitomicaceae bacterium]
MKRAFLAVSAGLLLASCGGYSEDQGKAATAFCDCMDQDTFGDYDINYYECNEAIKLDYKAETFADEGWTEALAEKCPDVADKMEVID